MAAACFHLLSLLAPLLGLAPQESPAPEVRRLEVLVQDKEKGPPPDGTVSRPFRIEVLDTDEPQAFEVPLDPVLLEKATRGGKSQLRRSAGGFD